MSEETPWYYPHIIIPEKAFMFPNESTMKFSWEEKRCNNCAIKYSGNENLCEICLTIKPQTRICLQCRTPCRNNTLRYCCVCGTAHMPLLY